MNTMRLEAFDYFLPPGLIAQEPLPERDCSRLMIVRRKEGTISHSTFRELPSLLPAGSLLVMNSSKVIPARLMCRKQSGGKVEVLLTRRLTDTRWEGLLRPSRRVPAGTRLEVPGHALAITVVARCPGGSSTVELHYEGDFWELLSKCGRTPLPPYIKKNLEDDRRYQTIYAREKGSVAAPTAGLHFTEALFEKLGRGGFRKAFITLHIGPGTFRMVKTDEIEKHRMEEEYYSIPAETADAIREARCEGRTVVAVGTTTVRALESAYDSGAILRRPEGPSSLFIYPGFRFSIVEALITNFHLPRSTLIMLTSAFAGRDLLMEAYQEAIREQYRVYSLGDAMLIL
ncbi:MAG: tRNA preQ1(34) S-adenosylmethionine ribosyltransferase-isomerase QueA [Candidatus Eremiobacteraeota bacterium]|nr:tRNA preQ1(34) S-adenosylmethionine ribosyltransferase-isomerase QueA [Candidatus Eremiobacteraeota bacterium]